MANNRRGKTEKVEKVENDNTPSLTVVAAAEEVSAAEESAPRKNTVAALQLEVDALSESMAEIDAKLDKLQATVDRLEASTRVLAVEEDGELSPVSVSTLYRDVDVLKTISRMLVDRIKKNNAKVQQITDEADRLKTKYSRWL